MNVQPNNIPIHEYVREIKHQYGLTNKSLAKKLGVTMHSVQAWCTQRRKPSQLMVEKIKGAFQLNSGSHSPQTITKGEADDVMIYKQLIKLQSEKILLLENEITSLSKKLTTHVCIYKNVVAPIDICQIH